MSLAGSRTADVEAEAQAGHPHLLVIDDDPVIRDLVSEYLAKNDLRVTTAADAAAMRALLGREVMDLVLVGFKPGARAHRAAGVRCENAFISR